MDRREFLKWTGATSLVGLGGLNLLKPQVSFADIAYKGETIEAGWVNDPEVSRYFVKNTENPYLSQVNDDIRGTGKGQIALLWPFLEQVTGKPLVPHAQETGDCVSHSFGLGVDLLTATQIVKRNSPQRWVAPVATEVIYGGRREIGRKDYHKYYSQGMNGIFAAEFVKRYGPLLRQRYLDNWDFTDYSGDMARKLGGKDLPAELKPLCKVHPVGCITLARSWEEARDCVFNGYPVLLSSSQGFTTRGGRDKDGFLAPSRNSWMHSMCLAGIDDSTNRPGGLIINSWGSTWIDGPKRHNQPDGSFWADASVIDRMCRQGDTIAISCYAGYPRQDYIFYGQNGLFLKFNQSLAI